MIDSKYLSSDFAVRNNKTIKNWIQEHINILHKDVAEFCQCPENAGEVESQCRYLVYEAKTF